MAKVKTTNSTGSQMKIRPALTPESRENQLIDLAITLAEQQLRDGTATSQVITHFLKLGTTVAQLEKEKLEKENKLLDAKTHSIESEGEQKVLYENAIAAMMKYKGVGSDDY